jgi:hypothetical protein
MEGKTISEALGITDEWRTQADNKIEQMIEDEELVSDVIEKMIHDIKEEEFGEGPYELTQYEKKLAYMGFMVLSEISARSHAAAMTSSLLDFMRNLGKDRTED